MISKQLEVRIGLNNWFIFNYVLLDSFKKIKINAWCCQNAKGYIILQEIQFKRAHYT